MRPEERERARERERERERERDREKEREREKLGRQVIAVVSSVSHRTNGTLKQH
jgi:hypothetical protein